MSPHYEYQPARAGSMRQNLRRPQHPTQRGSARPLPVPRFIDVLLPVALDQPYSYRVPRDLDLAAGDLVHVPLGARVRDGRCLGRPG